jgi:hypothetical protein
MRDERGKNMTAKRTGKGKTLKEPGHAKAVETEELVGKPVEVEEMVDSAVPRE